MAGAPATEGVPGSIPGIAGTVAPVPTLSIPGVVIPNSPIYMEAALQAKTAYQNALAQINQQRQSTLQQYGYMGSVDPNSGTISGVKVDPNNPYGLYEEMLSKHAAAQNQAIASAEARGLGHGGLAAQGITADHRSFGADSAQLGDNLMNTLEGFQSQQTQAQTTMNDALWQAELAAAQQAILQQLFDTAAPGSDGGGGDGGGGGATGTGADPTRTYTAPRRSSVFAPNNRTQDRRVRGGRI